MAKESFSAKKNNKIALAILSGILFIGALFWIFISYLSPIGYIYHSQNVVNDFLRACIIIALSLALFILVIVFMFKGKRAIRIACAILLIISIPVSACIGFLGMLMDALGIGGCSYTEDIANYGKYDRENPIPYFPKSITEDMTVIDFSYFYTYIDRNQTDIYLEVRFSDNATMEKYLNTAKDAFSEKGFIEYENPYDSKYTDIVENVWVLSTKHADAVDYYVAHIEFDSHLDYRYVHMNYCSISYSYDELTIIYNYTSLGSDIILGNDHDHGEYYPHYLTRFNVEWSEDNNFYKKLGYN